MLLAPTWLLFAACIPHAAPQPAQKRPSTTGARYAVVPRLAGLALDDITTEAGRCVPKNELSKQTRNMRNRPVTRPTGKSILLIGDQVSGLEVLYGSPSRPGEQYSVVDGQGYVGTVRIVYDHRTCYDACSLQSAKPVGELKRPFLPGKVYAGFGAGGVSNTRIVGGFLAFEPRRPKARQPEAGWSQLAKQNFGCKRGAWRSPGTRAEQIGNRIGLRRRFGLPEDPAVAHPIGGRFYRWGMRLAGRRPPLQLSPEAEADAQAKLDEFERNLLARQQGEKVVAARIRHESRPLREQCEELLEAAQKGIFPHRKRPPDHDD